MPRLPAFQHLSKAAVAVIAATALFGAKPVSAHPHEWIEMQIDIVFDDDGKAIAMRHDWKMDEFFSAYAVSDIEFENGRPTPAALDALMNEMLTNISDIGFFIQASQAGAPLPLISFNALGLQMNGPNLEMQFEVPFLGPLDLQASPLTYKIFDPEYYIEMLHIEGAKPIVLANAPKGCRWDLIPPSDNQSMAAYASALGQDESPTFELGSFFAEEASIRCH